MNNKVYISLASLCNFNLAYIIPPTFRTTHFSQEFRAARIASSMPPFLCRVHTRIHNTTQSLLHDLAFFLLRKDKYKPCLYTLRLAHYLHTSFHNHFIPAASSPPPLVPPSSQPLTHTQNQARPYDDVYFHILDLLALKHLLYASPQAAYTIFTLSLREKQKCLQKGDWELIRSRIRIARAVVGMKMWEEGVRWYGSVLDEWEARSVGEGEGRREMEREVEGVRDELEGCLEMVGRKVGMGEGHGLV
ncbi:hypothetical protein BKA63DRAFT_593551 [Paraphoma chrysanthemicola]|nr:hypothetical protein BKA63DRAFT_593551 [Paraphoma chrysanthemicola]